MTQAGCVIGTVRDYNKMHIRTVRIPPVAPPEKKPELLSVYRFIWD